MLPIMVPSNNDWLAANGFMQADALDTRVETLGGLAKPHMVTDNMTLFASLVLASSQTNLYFSTGNSDLVTMNIVMGYGGYFTVTDHADLEFGNNFTVNFTDTYIGAGTISYKTDAIYLTDTGVLIYDASKINFTYGGTFTDPDSNWTNDSNSSDNNTASIAGATAINHSLTVTFTTPAQYARRVGVYVIAYNGDDPVNLTWLVEAYYSGAWNTIYTGTIANETNVYYTLSGFPTVSALRMTPTAGSSTVRAIGEMRVEKLLPMITYSSIAGSESDLVLYADTSNLVLTRNGVTVNSTSLGGLSVPGNANNYIFGGTAVSYIGSLRVTTGGTLRATYAPASMIIGTNLPNTAAPGSYNGTFTWGANPAGIAATLGGLVSSGQPDVGSTSSTSPNDRLPESGGGDWFGEPAVAGALLTNPLRPFVTLVSDNTTLTELQTWRWMGLIVVLLVTAIAVKTVPRHLIIACIAAGVATVAMVVLSIWPLWALALLVLYVVGGVISERSPSL